MLWQWKKTIYLFEDKYYDVELITREQYLEVFSETNGISLEKATEIVDEKLKNYVIELSKEKNISLFEASTVVSRGGTYYARFSRNHNIGAGYVIQTGAYALVATGSGHSNFVSIANDWSAASGSGNYSWNEFFMHSRIGGPYRNALILASRGALEVTINSSLQGTIGVNLIAANFSISSSTNNTITYRKVVDLDSTIYIN